MHLAINQLTKTYANGHVAINRLSLSFEPGLYGLLGPNGAGKSTLMRILSTLSQPTQGQVTLNGVDIAKSPNEVRKILGYLPQDFGVYPNLSAVEFLEYMGALKGLDRRLARERIQELLALLNLEAVSNKPIGSYSGGMRQRVGIAQAILNDPQILIVDEPTVGLDPEERVRFRNLLSDLSGQRLIILSTHIVSDVESIASEIIMMNQGSLIATGTPEALIESTVGKVWEFTVPNTEVKGLRNQLLISNAVRRSDGTQLRVIHEGAPVLEAREVSPGLEEAYLYYLNQSRSTSRKGAV